MDDQRVVRRPSLRGEQSSHGSPIERVRAEAVHRFSREGDKAARAKAVGRPLDRAGIGPKDGCH
jgi:hypothetical protein